MERPSHPSCLHIIRQILSSQCRNVASEVYYDLNRDQYDDCPFKLRRLLLVQNSDKEARVFFHNIEFETQVLVPERCAP
jgi:hypothetical protein